MWTVGLKSIAVIIVSIPVIIVSIAVIIALLINYINFEYTVLSGACWKYVKNEASELSEKLKFTNAMNDMLFSNGLITEERTKEIRAVLSEAKWKDFDTYVLLMDDLPKNDDLGYMKFCCLLRAKSILPTDGKRLCNKCKPFRKCTRNETVQFNISSSCQSFLNNTTDDNIEVELPVDVNYLDKPDIEKSLKVYTSSFVCIDNNVTATLTISVEERYIEKDLLQRNIALTLSVRVSEVKLSVSTINSTWMFLYLSYQAGLRLMKTFSTNESKRQFGQMIARALNSKSARNVSVVLKLSNLPSYTIYVIPTGTFPVKSYGDPENQRMWTAGEQMIS